MSIPRPRDLMLDPRKRGIVAVAVLGVLLLAAAWPLAVGRDARHLTAYRDGEEDISRLHGELVASGVDVRSIHSTPRLLDEIEDPRSTVLLIVGNERRYSAGEAEAVVQFLRRGGSVVLADEGGFGTDVAREAGFAFTSERVLDTRNYRGDQKLVVAQARVGLDDFDVVFNSPASLVPLFNAGPHDVLVTSSKAEFPHGSFLDKNANGEIDVADPAGPFPLVVRATVGEGTLILVADTGVFMNEQSTLPEYENAKFARALLGTLVTSDATLLIDESRHAPTAAYAAWATGLRVLGRLTGGPLAAALTLGVLLAAAIAAWRWTKETEDWSHHRHDVEHVLPLSETVQPDLGRLQRMARRRVSERFNIPLEQVAAMSAEELQGLTGDRVLADAAAGNARGDPTPLFRAFSTDLPPEASP